MKYLITSDWHIRTTSPRYRTDNFYLAQLCKLEWIIAAAEFHGCEAILQGGDMFDGPDIPNHAKIKLANMFYASRVPILTVYGQHDLKYRRREDSVLTLMDEVEAVTLTNGAPNFIDQNTAIYGCSWGEEIPNPKNKDSFNILLIHRMIVKDKPLWPGQTDFITTKNFIKKGPVWDLIVSGDNHQTFTYQTKKTTLLNSGSLMRTRIDQKDHQPCVFIYDTDTRTHEQFFIPVDPFSEVMNMELSESTKTREEDLEAFMVGLSSNYEVDLDFEKNLGNTIKENDVSKPVEDLAMEIVGRYYS
jgi:DNA repair exonuclease SbcCD nuclease subunit